MTPFRASWPGDTDGSLPSAVGLESRAEALEAMRELCQAASAMNSGGGFKEQHSKARVGSHPPDSSKLPAAKECGCHESSAAIALRLAAVSAARLGLEASVRAAAAAAALQLRVWDSQDAALLAQAWSLTPTRSRTVSGAGMAEPLIRISTGGGVGARAERMPGFSRIASEYGGTELPGSGRPSLRCKTLSAAVTLGWEPRIRASASGIAVAICWPQCSAAASERTRRQWQEQHMSAVAASGVDQRLAADAGDGYPADGPDSADTQWPPDRMEPAADGSISTRLDVEDSSVRPRR